MDLYRRRLLAAAMRPHPDAELAGEAIKMAVARAAGVAVSRRVIFHTDRGSTYTAERFHEAVPASSGSGSRWDGSDRAC